MYNKCITLINVNINVSPPEEGPNMLTKVIKIIACESKGMVILGGDLNLIMCPEMDTQSSRQHNAIRTAKIMKEASMEMGLIDIWRTLHPGEKDYTFYSNPHDCYSRLDYFFTFKKDLFRIKSCSIDNITLSDHAPITLVMDVDLEKRRSVWRMNNSLLQDRVFKTKIQQVIKDYIEMNTMDEIDPIILWEGSKVIGGN